MKKRAVTGSAPGAIRGFRTSEDFAAWLEKNHRSSPAVWVRVARKGSGKKSITYVEGVEVALCYGWIDAQKLPESETAWLQRFLPRRPRSIWSKINREKAIVLISSGKMKPAGLEGQGVFQNAESSEQLRDHMAHPDGQETGDAGAAHQDLHRDAGERRNPALVGVLGGLTVISYP